MALGDSASTTYTAFAVEVKAWCCLRSGCSFVLVAAKRPNQAM